MTVWRITGRYLAEPPPADWRPRLAERLGHRPRRLGTWAELALFGALECLAGAGETTLPSDALLSVASLRGPNAALLDALREAREGLPLPIGFLNSQPSQLLPALARYLAWQGDGRCLTTRDPADALRLGVLEAGPAGALLGWVDEAGPGGEPGKSLWLRLVPAAPGDFALRPGRFDELAGPAAGHLAFSGPRLLLGERRKDKPG